MSRAAAHRLPARFAPSAVAGAKPVPFLGFVEPCHPTLRQEAPSAVGWFHEIKFDGYRTQAHLRKGRSTIYTRRAYDWTLRFRTIADALAALPAQDIILDGEAVVADSRGIPDFGLLDADLAAAANLIYLDGFVMDEPSVPQASFLAGLVPGPRAPGTTPEWAAVRLL
jgi:ATP-dependent DNA ligase